MKKTEKAKMNDDHQHILPKNKFDLEKGRNNDIYGNESIPELLHERK